MSAPKIRIRWTCPCGERHRWKPAGAEVREALAEIVEWSAREAPCACNVDSPVECWLCRWHSRATAALAARPAVVDGDAVREAAEVIRTILTAHDARLSESGVLTYGPPSKGTGFVAAIQWLRRYDAARGGE